MLRQELPLGTICALLLALGPGGSVAALSPQEVSPPEDRAALLETWEARRLAPVPVDGGWQAHNPGQQWRTRFDGRSFTVEPDSQGWSWGLALVSYGLAGAERPVDEPRGVTADGPRVAYDWDGVLEEWWVNDGRGLEHGFTLERRPFAPAESAGSEPGALSLLLAVRGGLRPEVEAGGRDVRFLDEGGALALTYRGLVVQDADGRELPAGFERVTEGLRLTIDERGARYPLTIDPIVQQAYLKASNTGSGDWFGFSVAISGDTAVIGAPFEKSNTTGVDGDQANNGSIYAGAAYVFGRSGLTWSQQAYLKASNTSGNDQFGISVAISGDTVVIGAQLEESNATGVGGDQTNNSASNSGAAYVFVRSGSTWSQQAYLKASNTGSGDQFGISVAISGNTLAIGASLEDSNATSVNGDQASNDAADAGAVYVFVRNGSTWSQQAYLKASNTEASDTFGNAIAVSDDTVAVAARQEDSSTTGVDGNQGDNGALSAGAAYVFVRSGMSWSQQAYLKASNTEAFDFFGHALALSGGTLLIGAIGEDSSAIGVGGDQTSNGTYGSGAAYVFARGGGVWAQEAYLKATNTGFIDEFGFAVAIADDTALVSTPREDSNAVGANGDDGNTSACEAGAAYAFVRRSTGWEHLAYLKASNTEFSDQFGWSVGISGGKVLVGAVTEDSAALGVNGDQASNSAGDSGAAYVVQLCPEATVAFRNTGSNPASYTASPAVLGGTFTATVDNNVARQTTSLLFAFDTPTSIALGGGQTLLCLDLGSGELFTGGNLFPVSSAGGVDSYTLAIPNLPQLEDALAYTQALQFGHPPFVLSNAQDLTVGAF